MSLIRRSPFINREDNAADDDDDDYVDSRASSTQPHWPTSIINASPTARSKEADEMETRTINQVRENRESKVAGCRTLYALAVS